MSVCLCVPYRRENYRQLDDEILPRSRLFFNSNDRLYAAARSFKKNFQKFWFLADSWWNFDKKTLQPPSEIGHTPFQTDKILSFGMGNHFQPQKSKNIKTFSNPKIFRKFKTTISRLLFMPGSSATAQIKGYCIKLPISYWNIMLNSDPLQKNCQNAV